MFGLTGTGVGDGVGDGVPFSPWMMCFSITFDFLVALFPLAYLKVILTPNSRS